MKENGMERTSLYEELSSQYEELSTQPIPQISQELREAFGSKKWKKISIAETTDSVPKKLDVVPNTPFPGKAMGWPAYYKFINTEAEIRKSGFGELAEMLEGELQVSPLVKLRPKIKNMLDKAQQMLDQDSSTKHLKLVVVDGYRTLDVQRRLFNAYLEYLRGKMPNTDETTLLNEAQQMVSIVPKEEVIKQSPPPHSTGGSVDIILVDKSKIDITDDYWLQNAMINFGAQFDEMMHPEYGGERSETAYYEDKSGVDEEAMKNRRLLYNLLNKVGLSNYPHEFWHFDFGNQFHALVTGKDTAEYGFAGGINNDVITENLLAEEEAFARYKKIHPDADKVKSHFGLSA